MKNRSKLKSENRLISLNTSEKPFIAKNSSTKKAMLTNDNTHAFFFPLTEKISMDTNNTIKQPSVFATTVLIAKNPVFIMYGQVLKLSIDCTVTVICGIPTKWSVSIKFPAYITNVLMMVISIGVRRFF